MAWNEPGGNRNDKDPWGSNGGGNNQGPPDLDEAIKQMMNKINALFGGSSSGKGGSGSSGGGQGSGGVVSLVIVLLAIFLIWKSVYTDRKSVV